MDTEIDRMMFLRRISIIFFVAVCFVVISIAVLLIIMGGGDYGGANSDFAELDGYGEAVTQKIEVESFDTLYFFAEEIRSERTLFTDAIPNLKIVNSDKYYLEITSSQGLIDKLRIENEDNYLTFAFKEECYGNAKGTNRIYKGLYVDCDVFDVTVYAPVSVLLSSAEINLDFDAPKTETLGIVVGGEVREGKVYNIDTEILVCTLNGASDVELSGCAQKGAQLEAKHNSKIDGDDLITPYVKTGVSCQIFGYSYIDGNGFSDYPLLDMGFLITHGIIFLLIISVCGFVMFKYKFEKQKSNIDRFINMVETEGNFLIKPKKTEEKLLQNNE